MLFRLLGDKVRFNCIVIVTYNYMLAFIAALVKGRYLVLPIYILYVTSEKGQYCGIADIRISYSEKHFDHFKW